MLRRTGGLLIAIGLIVGACSNAASTTAPSAAAPSAAAPSAAAPSEAAPSAAADKVKIGFITKFPVDFYDIMVDAAKTWAADHPGRRGRVRAGQERDGRRG